MFRPIQQCWITSRKKFLNIKFTLNDFYIIKSVFLDLAITERLEKQFINETVFLRNISDLR